MRLTMPKNQYVDPKCIRKYYPVGAFSWLSKCMVDVSWILRETSSFVFERRKTMLTSDELSLLCQRLGLSSQAQAVLEHIRSSPPARRVGSGGKNVPVRYPSRKMGMIIQAESRTVEFAGVYMMEH